MEVYDLSGDPHQLTNIVKTMDPDILLALDQRRVQLSVCAGKSCQENKPSSKKSWKYNRYENEVEEKHFHKDAHLKDVYINVI